MRSMNSSSPVPFQYSQVAQPTSAEMWCSSRPERMGIISPCGADAVRRRGLDALVGRLPGKERPLVAHVARLLAGAVEVAVAVGEQRAGRLGVRVDEERHDEDLGVPEDVVEVRQARQAAGADRDGLLGGMGRRHHVVGREAQGKLGVGVAADRHGGVGPALAPGLDVAAQQLVEPGALGPLQDARARSSWPAGGWATRPRPRCGRSSPARRSRAGRRSRRATARGSAPPASRPPVWSRPPARGRRPCDPSCAPRSRCRRAR